MPFVLRVHPGRMAAIAATLFAAFALPASPAAATASKPFSVSFSANPVPAGVSIPGGMPAGMTIEHFTVTLRNDTKTQKLGSANVTPPQGFTVASTPTVDRGMLLAPLPDGTLQLRELYVAPGKTVTLTLDLRLPCVTGPATFAWTINAKQSNDYNGTGNDLTPPAAAALKNTVTGACALRFVSGSKPAGAEKNQQIRGDEFQPASPNLVSVEAVDGRAPALAQRLNWFTGQIALALGATTYPGQLVQSGPVTAQAGVARFSNLSITEAGIYTLRASTTAPGFAAGDPRSESPAFRIVDVAEPCAATCTATLGATTITGGQGTAAGLLLLSRNVGADPTCAGYTPPVAGTWYEFEVTVQRQKTIVIEYTEAQMRKLKKASALQVCFATPGPDPFPAKSGPAAPYDYDGNGSAEGFIGLLPNCGAVKTGPCVTRRKDIDCGGALIEFFVPVGLGDPRYH